MDFMPAQASLRSSDIGRGRCDVAKDASLTQPDHHTQGAKAQKVAATYWRKSPSKRL
jgi:hypothetical protein